MRTDPIDLLERLRPGGTPSDWSEDEQTLARQRITTAPLLPSARGGRRRLATGLAVSFVVATGGIGVATATGLMPSAFNDEYAQPFLKQPLAGQSGIDPSKAERLASTPGPGGTTFSVFAARGSGTYVCTTSVFEQSPASGPGPTAFVGGGSVCQTATENGPDGLPFEGPETDYIPEHDVLMLRVPAGEAASAEVRTTGGQIIPMIAAEGWFYGWCPNEPSSARFPTLAGYTADGSLVARTAISGVTPYTASDLNGG